MTNRYFLLLFLLFYISSFSQKKKYIFIDYHNTKLKTVLKDIENNFDVTFSYSSNLIKEQYITLHKKKGNLEDLLFEMSNITNLDFNAINKKYIYITERITQNLDEVVVHNYLTKGIQKKKDASFVFSTQKIGLLAGLTEADVLESIQQLPGVISVNETATQLNVRGGTADQNQLIWDDINIYHGGHLFGMVSVFNPNVAETIRFYNKGTNPKYGDRISSVIAVETNSKIKNKSTAEIGINGINADAVIHFPVWKNKMDMQLSFRRSYEDIYETQTFKKFEEKAFQNTHIDDEFFYFKDYNLKSNIKYNKDNLFSISYIHIDNDLESEFHKNLILNDFRMDSENDGYNAIWNRKWNNKINQKSSISYSDYRFDFNNDKSDDLGFISSFTKENYINDTSFYSEINLTNSNNDMLFGYQFNHKKVSFRYKEKKDILYILDFDNSNITQHALYYNINFSTKNNYNFNLGLRTNYYQQFDAFRIEPRFVISKKLNNQIKLQLTGEIKDQIISQIDESILSDLSLENKIWRLADNDKYPIINGRHISLGGIYKKNNWTFDVDFFHKTITGISALALGFLNPLDNEVHTGIQKNYGIDFYAKKRFNHLSTWISYSFLNIKNKYEGINNNRFFTANTQIKHNLTTTLNYDYKKIKIALSWRIRTGKPLTDLDYDNQGNAYFHGINTEELPIYHRLDFSTVYHFKIGKKTKAKAGFSLKNIYDNKNHINTLFTGNQALNDPVKVTKIYAIGFTPNFMFRVYL